MLDCSPDAQAGASGDLSRHRAAGTLDPRRVICNARASRHRRGEWVLATILAMEKRLPCSCGVRPSTRGAMNLGELSEGVRWWWLWVCRALRRGRTGGARDRVRGVASVRREGRPWRRRAVWTPTGCRHRRPLVPLTPGRIACSTIACCLGCLRALYWSRREARWSTPPRSSSTWRRDIFARRSTSPTRPLPRDHPLWTPGVL